MTVKKTLLASSLLLSTAGIAWASCGGTEGLVAASAGSLASSISERLVNMTAQVVQMDNLETDSLISGLRVLNRQLSISSEKVTDQGIKNEQANAAFQKELADKELVDRIVLDYTSQGFDPCGISSKTTKMAQAEQLAKNSVGARIKTEVEAIGKYADMSSTIRAREDQHRELFCTASEVAAGYCRSVGKVPGGDTNAALLFGTDISEEQIKARNAFINNIIGLPDQPIPTDLAGSPEGAAFLMEKKQKDAFLGFAANSLKSIQSDNEVFKKTLDARIGEYFGTARADEWAKSQASQAQRGILVDLVKIQGISLKLAELKLRQGMRMEGNVALLNELQNKVTNTAETKKAQAIVLQDQSRKKVQ